MSSTSKTPNKFYKHPGNSPWNNHLLHIALVGKFEHHHQSNCGNLEMFFNDWDLVFFVESENKLIGLQKEDATPAVFGGKHEDVGFCSVIVKNRFYCCAKKLSLALVIWCTGLRVS